MPIKRWTPQSLLLLLLFLVLAVLAVFPLYALALASLKPSKELLRMGLNLKWDFEIMSFKNYAFLFSESAKKYLVWYGNSLGITAVYTVLSLLLSSMVGYGIAMYRFPGRNLIFVFVLLVMMVPVEIIMLPLYKQMISLRMIDTFRGVVLPFLVAPLPIFFFRQYAEGLPKDFLDAGRMDGCTEYGIFFRIMVPLMAPAFGAMAILQALGSWNSFVWPLIVLKTGSKLTLPIGLSSLVTPYGNNYDILIAGSVIAIVPILLVFIFFQRYFVSGLTVGGVKG
ncbi:carbohydrate ABC transporter permease [Cohnella candidum]|uniref:Carbohydrate ABC transporter permease n=1 Tax=Cohnella candidum TaxID=2674991 RepID=A0A3G3K072_9BACL|nr:carbohydrate ABC transporter permease [Cohnella candidum]AYQ73898.1 carbohydrate ABC transporter permease [Cohnella candidum]